MTGFQQPFPDFRCPSLDGKNFILLGPLDYIARDGTHYRAITGTTTDGPSIPPKLASVVSSFGPIWAPAILHDAAYRATLVKVTAAGESVADLTKAQRDSLFSEAMDVNGVPETERIVVYSAVHYGGESSLEGDLALPIA